MEMNYDGTMVLPNSFAIIGNEEKTNINGGAVLETVLGIIAIHGAGYGAGHAAGIKAGHAGITRKSYGKYKWAIRSATIAAFQALGVTTLMGFENGLYSIARK